MHHLALERWSRGHSPLHRLDARIKTAVALAFLLCISFTLLSDIAAQCAYLCLLGVGCSAARLPLTRFLLRGLIVLPFVAGIVILNLMGGDTARAWLTLTRSYLSALTVLLLLATTPFPKLLRGLEALGAPAFFVMVLQFVYRYLFILFEQAHGIRLASQCRAPRSRRQTLFSAAAGAVAVLFARSYGRAERIHHAMLARGFEGHFVLLEDQRVGAADWIFLAVSLAVLTGLQVVK